jgi:cytidylate kinase
MSVPQSPPRPLVTISAPYGAGGSIVGPRLAERLGVEFLDRAIPATVARRLQIPLDDALGHEQAPRGTVSEWMAHVAPAVQMFGGAPIPDMTPTIDSEEFRVATEQVLLEAAAHGSVILGRAGACVLREWPSALHVRLDGPPARRVRQAIELLGIERDAADRERQTLDLARESYVKHWYRVDPAAAANYHLVIDSTSLALDACVDLIALAARARAQG